MSVANTPRDMTFAEYKRRLRSIRDTPYRLRFELGIDSDPPSEMFAKPNYIEMFTVAYDRARQIARDVFGDQPIIAIVSASPSPWSAPWGVTRYGEVRESAFDALAEMKFPAHDHVQQWVGYRFPHFYRDFGNKWENRAYAVSLKQMDLLLWNNLAHEIGIRPFAPVYSIFTDETCSVCLNAYDDRGMDVYAVERERIAPLYVQRAAWLNAYDRDWMADVFGDEVGAPQTAQPVIPDAR